MEENKKILIVGLGLMGGSYAMGLSKRGYSVSAIAHKKADIEYALENGLIQDGTTEVSKEYVSSFRRIVFALYPKTFLSWIRDYGSYFAPGTIITDVTGVKSSVVYKVQSMMPEGTEYIGAHPMAGREVYGVKNATDTMFHDANYIITPTEKNTQKAIDFAYCLGKDLDFARISILTPEKHDEMIAFLSQLTHCIAVTLMACKDSIHLSEYTGDSFRDLTRIANINEDMWTELFMMNKEPLLKEMNLFADEFARLRDAIAKEDTETIKEMMRLSTHRRSYFNRKD